MNFMPIFDAAAHELRSTIGVDGRLQFGKINCLEHPGLESRFNVGKYPTVKIVRFGRVRDKEYRGQRSQDALGKFVYKELQGPIAEFQSMSDLHKLRNQKDMIIGYFEHKDLYEYEVFRKTALTMTDNCQFHVSFGEAAMSMNPSGQSKLIFERNLARSDGNLNLNNEYSGSMSSFRELLSWMKKMCKPVVRELTFENTEEISEEGRPFLILFHDASDLKSVLEFENVIEAELMDQLDNINFLTADGKSFAHPLYHLDKSEEDLPLIVIDSFMHMYVFPNYTDIHTPGKLKQFINNLFSGQLHTSFHITQAESAESVEADIQQDNQIGQEEITLSQESTTRTPVYKSKFKKLLPSKNRYTFAKDEL
ncbi:hypothetical protein ACLKA7_008957 [Drosophila subpalustris]